MSFQSKPVENNVKGRYALVTGGSGGLGKAICEKLAEKGMNVMIHYSSNKDAATSILESLSAKYPSQSFSIHPCDLSSLESIPQFIYSLPSHPEVLILNAGIARRIRNIEDIPLDYFEEVIRVNLTANFVIAKECIPAMKKEGWGRIVVISSIAKDGGGVNGCHYAASKGGVTSMAYNLATILAPTGITVNSVSPGMVITGMIPRPTPGASVPIGVDSSTGATASSFDAAIKAGLDPGTALASTMPVGRLGEAEEVAEATWMFVSSGYITGQDLRVSGGLR